VWAWSRSGFGVRSQRPQQTVANYYERVGGPVSGFEVAAGHCPSCGATSIVGSRPYVANSDFPFGNLTVVTCRDCGTGRAFPMPTEDALERYYNSENYEDVEASPLPEGTGAWDLGPARASAQVQMVTNWTTNRGTWLDVGAGYGFLLDAAQRAGWSTFGVEPGPVRREHIRTRGHTLFESLDQADTPSDVVSISHCLEHVTDPIGFLEALRAKLTPTGIILCEVPNDAPGAPPGRSADEPHVVFFTEAGLSKCAESAKLRVLVSRTVGRRRQKRGPSVRDAVSRFRGVLPDSLAPSLHWAFQQGSDRIWIRAMFAPD
jgi:hypothetical protein